MGHIKRDCTLLVARDSGFGYGLVVPQNSQHGMALLYGGVTLQARPSVNKASGAASSSQSRPIAQPDRLRTQARVFAMTQHEARASL